MKSPVPVKVRGFLFDDLFHFSHIAAPKAKLIQLAIGCLVSTSCVLVADAQHHGALSCARDR